VFYLTHTDNPADLKTMRRLCFALTALLSCPGLALAQTMSDDPLSVDTSSDAHPVKYAIYSPAWSIRSNAGLRVVAQNNGDRDLTMADISFHDESSDYSTRLTLDLDIPAGQWAETEVPYVDLLSGNDCINTTIQDRWRLMEISNYTLNPSVRGLIIEDTVSFRIYQCVREVSITWLDADNDTHVENLWVMYHFERVVTD
jgi:hypothetical protein